MDAFDLPTTEELTAWMQVPAIALAHATKLGADAHQLQEALRGVYTASPVGVYLHVDSPAAGLYGHDAYDLQLTQSAIHRHKTACEHITAAMLQGGQWVKVAATPSFIRQTGEALNFFPGHYPGGMPNHPGVVSSMLTSGLLGAGLGYGAGWLGEHFLPDRWEKGKLRRSLALAGGALGAAPGALFGLANASLGRNVNDSHILGNAAGTPEMNNADISPSRVGVFAGTAGEAPSPLSQAASQMKLSLDTQYQSACAFYAGQRFKQADDAADLFGGYVQPQERSPLTINVDALGRTLWETGANPQVAGMTMGALAAAQAMPGGVDQPGYVTPLQMAHLAANMGAGYFSGALVGATLGILTGMPEATQNKLKRTGMYVSVVKSIIPKLFEA